MGYLHLSVKKKGEPAGGEVWKWMFGVIKRKPEINMEGSFEKKDIWSNKDTETFTFSYLFTK